MTYLYTHAHIKSKRELYILSILCMCSLLYLRLVVGEKLTEGGECRLEMGVCFGILKEVVDRENEDNKVMCRGGGSLVTYSPSFGGTQLLRAVFFICFWGRAGVSILLVWLTK